MNVNPKPAFDQEPSSRQFLSPKSRQFPFDEVCEQIVLACQARAFQVPGFTVDTSDYGSGAQKLRFVSSIKNDALDVAITFGRSQGFLPGRRWNDIAAVCNVQLPRHALHVYEDESGPTYNVYVGDAWERDRSAWWSRPNARLNKESRLCVRYAGRRLYRGVRAAELVCDGDYREYAPEGEEPRSFCTAAIMEAFRAFLHDVVLPAIEAHPPTEAEVTDTDRPIPMPVSVGPFFTYGTYSDVRRIELGKKCLDDLPLAERYGMAGNGWRLAPLGLKRGGDFPEVAFDGFLWCGSTEIVPGEHGNLIADQLIKVTPKDAAGIYVADQAVYEKRRAELSKSIKKTRNNFTQKEIDSFLRARACTIVPITEYAGNYEEPVYLINRELALDEVEVIGNRP